MLHDLRCHLRHHILDIDIVANRFLELSVANDQITFDKVVKVLREHNIELDRGLLSRWIKYSRGSASATCSIDKLTDILRRAADPLLEQLELEDLELFNFHINIHCQLFSFGEGANYTCPQ